MNSMKEFNERSSSSFQRVVFEKTNLYDMTISKSILIGVEFSKCTFTCIFNSNIFEDVDFSDTIFKYSKFKENTFQKNQFLST